MTTASLLNATCIHIQHHCILLCVLIEHENLGSRHCHSSRSTVILGRTATFRRGSYRKIEYVPKFVDIFVKKRFELKYKRVSVFHAYCYIYFTHETIINYMYLKSRNTNLINKACWRSTILPHFRVGGLRKYRKKDCLVSMLCRAHLPIAVQPDERPSVFFRRDVQSHT